MADSRRKPGTGRVPPKGGPQPAGRAPRARPSGPRASLPNKIGPFRRPDANAAPGQVGRRPTPPGRLAFFGALYIVVGIISFFVLKGGFSIIIGIVFIGLGLLWLRGAGTAVLRRSRRGDGGPDA